MRRQCQRNTLLVVLFYEVNHGQVKLKNSINLNCDQLIWIVLHSSEGYYPPFLNHPTFYLSPLFSKLCHDNDKIGGLRLSFEHSKERGRGLPKLNKCEQEGRGIQI